MKLKEIIKLLTKLTLVSLALLMYSCASNPEDGGDDLEGGEEGSEVKENIERVLTDIPEPSEMPYLIKATGADFNAELPNNPSEVDKYKATNNKAALNLGVYATDVGYVSVYEKTQNALDYIDATKGLGDKLGVSNAFDPSMQERFKENLNTVDSLTNIINEALAQSDKYLKDGKRSNIAAMIFSGSFIEGLYIATQLVDTYPDDLLPEEAKNEVLVGIVKLITEQDKPLGDLVSALKSLDKEEEIDKLIGQLEELKTLYDGLNIDEQIQNNQGDLILTDETIKGITAKVKEIRADIVA